MSNDATLPTIRPAPAPPPPWLGLVLGLLAGGIAWAVIQAVHPVFLVPEEYHIVAMGAPPEEVEALLAATARTDRRNMTLYGALVGALLAGFLAAPGQLFRAVAIADTVGLLLGGLAGYLGSLAYAGLVTESIQTDMTRIVAAQAIVLGGLGLAAGVGFAAARGRAREIPQCAVGGLVAGGLAGALYPVLMSVAMPGVNTTPLVPLESSSRLIWIGLAAGLIGPVVYLAARRPTGAAPRPPKPKTTGC